MDILDLLNSLASAKVDASQKVKLFQELDAALSTSSEKEQYLIDSLYSCLDSLSSKEKLVQENANVINDLLSLFGSKIGKATNSGKKIHLNGNIYEVLSKFTRKREILDVYILFRTWKNITGAEDWNKVLLSKVNVLSEILEIVTSHYIQGDHESEKTDLIVSLLDRLTSLYIKQRKYEFNVKKLFQTFCAKLLVPMLCARSKLVNQQKDSTEIVENIDSLLKMVICHRDHLSNLKLIIEPNNTPETPSKRVKYQAYFEVFFEKIKSSHDQVNLIQSLPTVYNILIEASRLTKTFRNREELQIMVMMFNDVKLTETVTHVTIQSCLEFFNVVQLQDVYKRVEDKGNVHSGWMTDILSRMLEKYQECDASARSKILSLFDTIFAIDSSSGEPFLTRIIGYCLEQSLLNDAPKQEEVLINLLEAYGNLHKLEYFLDNFPLETNGEPAIPVSFVSRYCQILTHLQTSLIIRLLEMFERKSVVLLEEISDKNMGMLQHITHLMFYCVVTNASVVPDNLYSKPDLQKFIETMLKLKTKFESVKGKIAESLKSIQDKFESICILISIGVNEVTVLLKELALYDDDVENDKLVADVANDTSCPLIKYLKVWETMNAMKFHHITRDLNFLSQILEDCFKRNFVETEWNFQIFDINEKNFRIAIVHKVLDNFELFLGTHENGNLSGQAVRLLWNSLINTKNVKFSKTLNMILADQTIYNYTSFQLNLVKQVRENFKNIFGMQWPEGVDKSSSLVNNENLTRLLKNINSIRMEYLTEDHWLSMFHLFSSLFSTAVKSNSELEEAFQPCIHLLTKLFDDGQTACHKECQIPFVDFMDHLISLSLHDFLKHGCCNGDVLKLSHSFFQFFMIHVKRDVDDVTKIHQKLFSSFKKQQIQPAVLEILKCLLSSVVELLQHIHTIKGRTVLSIMDFLKFVLHSTQENLDTLTKTYRDSTYFIFSSICIVFEKLLHRKETRHKIEMETEAVCELSKHISSMLQEDLQHVDETEKKIEKNCLQVVLFICSKNNLSSSLRATMEFNGTLSTTMLIKAFKNDNTNRFMPDLISKLILSMGNEKCLEFLLFLSDELDKANQYHDRQIHIVEIWKFLLSSKWEKEQKEQLWKVLPKVILAATNIICHYEDLPCIKKCFVKVVSLAISISKSSHQVTRYISAVYHIFSKPSYLLHKDSFKEDFEELYQILSLILYMHSSTFAHSIHCFIEALNNLFVALISKTKDIGDAKDLEYCFTRISRLYSELSTHKATISKFSPYIIGGYIKICLSSSIALVHKKILDDGIYSVFDTCADEELAMMNTIFDNAEREYYWELRSYHQKHWKYTG